MPRYCSQCEKELINNPKFCPECGTSTSEKEKTTVKKHTGYGTASLVLGIIGMCLIWVELIPLWGSYFYSFLHFPLGILTIIFGSLGYWRRNRRDNFGLAGFILGVVMLISGFILALAMVNL